MGLDMYLTKRIYIGANYEHRNVKGNVNITVDGVEVDVDFNKIDSISFRAGYWRKANQIHNWFVQNVQDGEDNCAEYYVGIDKLEELLNTVNAVLASPTPNETAMELLPPAEGFFFGTTELDEWYWQDLEETQTIIKNALQDIQKQTSGAYVTFYYQSSW